MLTGGYDAGSTRTRAYATNLIDEGTQEAMSRLEQKRLEAPPALVAAVDIVSELIGTLSRHVSNTRLEQLIAKLFDENKRKLAYTIRYRVKEDRVDIFDGPFNRHAHVAIDLANGAPYYWRNIDDPYGSRNSLR